MTKNPLLYFLLLVCASSGAQESEPTPRWYSASLAKSGERVFKDNCASCHGDKAQGIYSDWQETLPDGNYPPPPLNGTAHAWHHSISVLAQYIYNGGEKYKGVMPGFKGKLSHQEAASCIAYFQSFWSDNLYKKWLANGGMDVDLTGDN